MAFSELLSEPKINEMKKRWDCVKSRRKFIKFKGEDYSKALTHDLIIY